MTEIKKLTDDDLNLVTGGKKPEEKGNKKDEVTGDDHEMLTPCK